MASEIEAGPAIRIGSKVLGPGRPVFVIAEAGVNHNGDMGTARALVDAATAAGADAVKFQSFRAERLAARHAPKAAYQVQNTPPGETQFEMLKKLELTDEAHQTLSDHCRGKGILFLSSPFDEERADFLDRLGVPAFKVPSGEATNRFFLGHLARKGKPLIVSTGICTLGEVEAALRTIEENGEPPVILLHCVSSYPADPAEINLRAMQTMASAFGGVVGFSDHTLGTAVALAAVALGACVIEKHFTLDRNLPGPDHRGSLEPDELGDLVRSIRTVESALGDGRKRPTPAEERLASCARKSLVAARDLPAGTVLGADMITAKRPGTGLSPDQRLLLLGKRLRRDVAADTLLSWDLLEQP